MNKVDTVLYCLISFGTAIAATHDPIDWRQVVLIVIAVLTTYKAKRSPGKPETPTP